MLQYKDLAASGSDGEGKAGPPAYAEHRPGPDKKQGKPSPNDALFNALGRLIHSWGTLEVQLERKIAQLRQAAGDVLITGTRTKPTMGRMLAELRAIVSMRSRRDNVQLGEIAEIERTIQQIDKFRMLVIQGFQSAAKHGESGNRPFLCRDAKNNVISIGLDELDQEIARLDDCRERLLAL